MSDDALHQPHDKLFKFAFSERETAVAAFRAFLPERVTRHLDFASAELEPGSFTDERFKALESDLLYRVNFQGAPAFVYILFEHQRAEDPWLALRLLSYKVRIWENWPRKNPDARALPVILPLVIAQNERRWDVSTKFSALFGLSGLEEAGPAAAESIPDFTFTLIELADLPFDRITGTPLGVITLRVLKAERLRMLLSDPVWDEPVLKQLPADAFRMILLYISRTRDVDRMAFEDKIQELRDSEIRQSAMTLAEQFIQEGMEKGRREGILMGGIRLRQEALGIQQSPVEALSELPLERLEALDRELSARWRQMLRSRS